jgi:hypothetical protein
VADVLDGRREGVDDLGVEHADRVGRVVVSENRADGISRRRRNDVSRARGLTGRWRQYPSTCP